ncbi:DUF5590 domain-containing protein [Sporosarcina sp. CAU 1771]
MLNWIKFITVFLLTLAIILTVSIFYNANKPVALAKTSAIDKATNSGLIVEYAQPYNGIEAVTTVFGENAEGEKVALFINETTEDTYEQVKLTDGITSETAVKAVKEELAVDTILHVKLGMEEVGAVWEVAFKSENGKLNYVYVLFENGLWWKRILNL